MGVYFRPLPKSLHRSNDSNTQNGQGFTALPCLWFSIIPSSKSSLNPKHHDSSFPIWCGDSHTSQSIPSLQLLFWAKHRRADDLCPWKHHVSITSKAEETKAEAGSIRQILPLVTAFSFTCITSQMKEGLFTLEYLHCKGKEKAFNEHRNKQTTVQSITINTDQRAQNGLVFHKAPCGTSFFLTQPSHSIFPHSYTNSPLIRSEKCDFQLSLLCFSSLSHPQPPAWCWPSQQTPSAPSVAPSNPGKKRPTPQLWLELISSAHLEAGCGLAGDHGGRGLDVSAVSCSVTHSRDGAAAAQYAAKSTIRHTVQAPTVLSWSSLIGFNREGTPLCG